MLLPDRRAARCFEVSLDDEPGPLWPPAEAGEGNPRILVEDDALSLQKLALYRFEGGIRAAAHLPSRIACWLYDLDSTIPTASSELRAP
jgi:hypothetical protein